MEPVGAGDAEPAILVGSRGVRSVVVVEAVPVAGHHVRHGGKVTADHVHRGAGHGLAVEEHRTRDGRQGLGHDLDHVGQRSGLEGPDLDPAVGVRSELQLEGVGRDDDVGAAVGVELRLTFGVGPPVAAFLALNRPPEVLHRLAIGLDDVHVKHAVRLQPQLEIASPRLRLRPQLREVWIRRVDLQVQGPSRPGGPTLTQVQDETTLLVGLGHNPHRSAPSGIVLREGPSLQRVGGVRADLHAREGVPVGVQHDPAEAILLGQSLEGHHRELDDRSSLDGHGFAGPVPGAVVPGDDAPLSGLDAGELEGPVFRARRPDRDVLPEGTTGQLPLVVVVVLASIDQEQPGLGEGRAVLVGDSSSQRAAAAQDDRVVVVLASRTAELAANRLPGVAVLPDLDDVGPLLGPAPLERDLETAVAVRFGVVVVVAELEQDGGPRNRRSRLIDQPPGHAGVTDASVTRAVLAESRT